MDKIANQRIYNETFIEMVKAGEVKEAAASAQQFTRNKLREESFTEKILTPITISNDDLHPAEDPELLVKWNDREPDQAPAVSVPLGVVPQGFQFKGSRYPSYFSRIQSPAFMKDIDKLRGYDYDIRGVLMENSTKDIAAEIDRKFITTVNSIIGPKDEINPLNGWGLPQWVSAGDVLNRETLADSVKHILRLRVPFGPLQPDGQESKGVILMNNVTAAELLKLDRSEVGGDLAQTHFVEGRPSPKILGLNTIYTLKRDLVPDYTVYFFSSEEFFGKYYLLQPLTVYMEQKAFFLLYFQYMNLSLSIGNVRGVVRVDFDPPAKEWKPSSSTTTTVA